MVNYANGKIYKIISDQTDKVYVGSTTKKYLSDRMYEHRNDYKRYLNGTYHYVSSFEILQYDDSRIVLLENLRCESKEELRAREEYYRKKINDGENVINKFACYRSEEQINEYNKAYSKAYYEKHYKKIATRKKAYYKK